MKKAYEIRISEGSSDVCSSDLRDGGYEADHGRRFPVCLKAPLVRIAGGRGAVYFGAHDPRHHLECGGIAHAADKEEQQHHGEEQWEAVRRQRPDHAGCCNHLHDEHPEGDRSEEHTSELQSLMRISYAVFCLKKKNNQYKDPSHML